MKSYNRSIYTARRACSRLTSVSILFLLLAVIGSVGAESKPVSVNKQVMERFIKAHCTKCHGPKRQRGDLRLDTIDYEISDNVKAQHWQDILDVLNAGEMPPEDERQPNAKDLVRVLAVLTENLEEARTRLAETGGVYTIRRINKREYVNTMKHLFGLNIDPAKVPDDIRSEHFDTAGSEQYFDAALLENYLRLGNEIAEEGFKWSAKPYTNSKVQRHEPDKSKGSEIFGADRVNGDKGYYIYHGNRKADTVTVPHGNDPRASYRFRVNAGLAGENVPASRKYLRVHGIPNLGISVSRTNAVLKVGGNVKNPEISELVLPRAALSPSSKVGVIFSEVSPIGPTNFSRWWPIYLKAIGEEKNVTRHWIDWIEVEGPLYDTKSNVFGTLISPKGENLGGPGKAKKLLEGFAFEAFRRVKPSSSYINSLVKFYETRKKEGAKHEQAMSETLGLILASPGFLYLEENKKSGTKELSTRAFATRLSHLLWSAPPDEELYKLAASGKLEREDEIKKQIERMLLDPRAESFYEGFMSQWYDLDRLEGIAVDWQKNIRYNNGILYSAHREPIEFFKHVVKSNHSVKNFIDSPYAVVNHQLAYFYGVDFPKSNTEFLPVTLPKDSPRGGILSQSAFLTIGSAGDRTSPVIRGTLILEKLLNNPPPPPPPNVPELGEASDKPLSNRELVQMHRKQKVCASCHDKIDPIGFGLENFDGIGLWREKEKVGEKEIKIDASAKLVSGKRFKGLNNLQDLLLTQEHKLARHVIESLVAYGIGRPVEFSDKQAIIDIQKAAFADKYQMRDMIYHVVKSAAFKGK